MISRERPFSDSIRWFARWGPWVAWGMAALLVAMVVFEIRSGSPVDAVIALITPVITNIGCGFLIRFMRPKMLANADAWDANNGGGS